MSCGESGTGPVQFCGWTGGESQMTIRAPIGAQLSQWPMCG